MTHCPFCGNTESVTVDKIHHVNDNGPDYTRYTVVCSVKKGGCGADCGWHESKEKAVRAWDNRVPRLVKRGTSCRFCKRTVSCQRSHVVPQCKGGKEWVHGCKCCESFIHATWSHNQLRDTYNTVEKIVATAEYQKFLRWLLKQPLTAYYRTDRNVDRTKGRYR